MDISKYKRYNPQMAMRSSDKPFECFVPDFTAENDLYNIDGEPINIIDNSKNTQVIQNIAQQQLQDVSDFSSVDTSNMSDKQLADSLIPRLAEVSDLEDVANNNLKALYDNETKL